MATASNFESYNTTPGAFEANAQPAETPKAAPAPFGVESGKGYREIAGKKSVRINPAVVFVFGVVGIALGGGAGLWLVTGGFAHSAARSAAPAHVAASHAQPAPVAVAQPQKQPSAASAPPARSLVSTPAAHSAPVVVSKPSASVPAAPALPHAGGASAKTRPAVFVPAKRHGGRLSLGQTPATPPAHTASAAEASIPALRPAVMIEGDVTVSDFDGASGRIETREGKSFILGHTAANAFSWDEFHASLHYRCDMAGNCSLSHPRVISANARQSL